MGTRGWGVVAAIVTEVLYGGSYIFTKGVTLSVDPVSLLAWRFVVAFMVLTILVTTRVVRVRLHWGHAKPMIALAALQPIGYYLGETYGVAATSASESGIVLAVIPVVTLLMAMVWLRFRARFRQVAGILLSVCGVAVTIATSSSEQGDRGAGGYALLGVAVVAFALFTVLSERYRHIDDVEKTFVMVTVGAVVFGGAALASNARSGTISQLVLLPVTDLVFAGAVAYLAIGCTLLALFLQNYAIRQLGAAQFSSFIAIATLTAMITGAIVLGETLTGWHVAGGVIILGGVYLANVSAYPARRRRSP